MKGLLGRKQGMTQHFDAAGDQVPVTVLSVGPCTVVQRKTAAKDGYAAVQLGFEPQTEKRRGKPVCGHCAAHNAKPVRFLHEVRLADGEKAPEPGTVLDASVFAEVPFVDVTGCSKGRGFQGVMRRWGMHGGRASHGSGTHRGPGSIGMNKEPSRVQKNKHMPGHMGNRRVTVQHLRVIECRPEEGLLLVRGAVPGPSGGLLFVRPSIKKTAVPS